METKHPFGSWLKAMRRSRDLSQLRLAELTGIDRAYISRLENGHVGTPTHETRMRLHEALGTTEDSLVEAGLLRTKTFSNDRGPVTLYETVPSRLEADRDVDSIGDDELPEGLPPSLRASFALISDLSPDRQRKLEDYINDLAQLEELERMKRQRP